jgi:hypothetical protein
VYKSPWLFGGWLKEDVGGNLLLEDAVDLVDDILNVGRRGVIVAVTAVAGGGINSVITGG